MEEKQHKCPPPGLPPWMGVFADLMSLLMCFFVLLLSFSEMDVVKFQQIAGSMKYAFGVQNKVEAHDIPKGTSVIAQEFRPGRPEPTPIEVIMQQTVDMTEQTLDFKEGETDRVESQQPGETDAPKEQERINSQQLEQLEQQITNTLSEQIESGSVEIENLGQQLIIRVEEQGSFPTGSAFLQPKFRPIIRQIAELVKDIPGEISISGHTDDQPLESELYRSNWDLSAQRAVSVAQEMENVDGFAPSRMRVEGLADSKPLVPNDSVQNRVENRRVEISVMQGQAAEQAPISSSNNPANEKVTF